MKFATRDIDKNVFNVEVDTNWFNRICESEGYNNELSQISQIERLEIINMALKDLNASKISIENCEDFDTLIENLERLDSLIPKKYASFIQVSYNIDGDLSFSDDNYEIYTEGTVTSNFLSMSEAEFNLSSIIYGCDLAVRNLINKNEGKE